jgi:hypothetical protein
MAMVWRGFERFLLDRLDGVERIVTPGWEPAYPDGWAGFLELMGYRRLNQRAFERRP